MKAIHTIAIQLPENEAERKAVFLLIEQLRPYQTGYSCEDDMTVLDLIENHDDFDEAIAEEAREKAKLLLQAHQ